MATKARTLNLGEGLRPPADLLLERGFVAGSPKTGKTSTCVVMVEEADALEIPSVVITPNDVWHGLRSDGSGEKPGLEHVIFGGSFADRPLHPAMGRGLARATADGLRTVLTCVGLSLDARATLVADFLEELLEVNRSPLLVVIDEAHRFAPEGKGGTAPRKRCREAIIAAVATGRMPAFLGVWLVTQRLAMLATDARELCNASIVHKLRGSNDIKFARPWLEDFLDDRQALDRLKHLSRGEAFVVAPDAGDIAGIYQIRPKWTYDTSNSDDALSGAIRAPKGRSTIDLSALDATLGEALREAEEHDPEVLRRRLSDAQARIARLERDGNGEPAAGRTDVAAVEQALRAQLGEIEADRAAARSDNHRLQEDLMAARDDLAAAQARLDEAGAALELVATLRGALATLLGDVSIAAAASNGGDYPGDHHVLELIRAHAPAGGAATVLQPVEKLRTDYLERTAQRLVERVRALEPDEREALLFLLAQQKYMTTNATAKALSGHDGGGQRNRWAAAYRGIVGIGLAAKGGSGGTGHRENVEAWVRNELGPHAPSDEEVTAVRDRALSVLQTGSKAADG